LGNWRGALIVTMAIPLSFLFALSGMVKLEVSGNLMSLGAVDFGLLIDGAVVIVENVVRQLGIRQREFGRRLTSEERRELVLAAIAIFAGSIWLFNRLGAEFVPKLDEGSITSMLYKPVEMSLDESVRTDLGLEKTLLREFPEITRIFTRIGTSDIATDPMPPNECDVYIFYKPLDQWPNTPARPRNKAELNSQIDATLKK